MDGLKSVSDLVKEGEKLKDLLKKDVVGQDAVIEEVVNAIVNNELYQRTESGRPKGLFLFAGTPGVGKTYLASKLAEALNYPHMVFNMSSYTDRQDGPSALFGLDYSWKNAHEGALLEFVYTHEDEPCFVILDEFEKACQEVILRFLQVFEGGKMESAYVSGAHNASKDGKQVPSYLIARDPYCNFEKVYFIVTTNVGRSLYEDGKQPGRNLTKETIIDAMRKDINPATEKPYFPDAILSRLQTGTVTMFRHLQTHELVHIARNVLDRNAKMVQKQQGIFFQIKSKEEEKIPTLLLLREGGAVDARNFRTIAENFIRTQIANLCNSLREEYLDVKEIVIGVDPEETDKLNDLLYGDGFTQDVILVCEDERKLNLFSRFFDPIEDINLLRTTDYEEALEIIRGEIYAVPAIFVLMPSLEDMEGLTMGAVSNAMQTRDLQGFAEFISKAREIHEKAEICVIDVEQITHETKKDLRRRGATQIIEIKRAETVTDIFQQKVDAMRLNAMAFDFARKGKALKFDIVPSAYQDLIFLRLRYFEKVENVKSTDAEFLVGGDRMPKVSFKDVVGGETVKEEAADFIDFLRNPKGFVEKGLRPPKGMLFYGPAGTGKTFMAKAIAHEAGVPFIASNGGDIKMGMKNLSGSETLKKLLSIARKYAPSILFIDEMETIALNRTGRDPYADTLVNTLLSEMDGFEGHEANPVIIIGATNAGISPETNVDGRYLAPAVVRRFSRKFFVDLPVKKDRMAFLVKNTGFTEEELDTAAQMGQGLSFGKLGNAIEIAKRQAARAKRSLICRDVEEAVETETYGESREVSRESKERTAYHEGGHACLGCLFGGANMPDHATIVSRGDFGGYVSIAMDEQTTTITKTYYENRIRIALAGRCAEIIHFGETEGLSAGPSSDIRHAFRMILEMICHLGMDDVLGMTYYDYDVSGRIVLTEKIQERADQLLSKYYEEAKQLLLDNRGLFEDISESLLRKESLSKADLEVIMEKHCG